MLTQTCCQVADTEVMSLKKIRRGKEHFVEIKVKFPFNFFFIWPSLQSHEVKQETYL